MFPLDIEPSSVLRKKSYLVNKEALCEYQKNIGQGTVLCPTVSQFRALARPLNGYQQGRGGAIDKRITDKTENRPLSYTFHKGGLL